MEIERKFLVNELPAELNTLKNHRISQGYISTDPVVRIRQLDDDYILTIKSSGLLAHQEIEKPLSKDEYDALSEMVKGNLIEKTRYILPLTDYNYPDLILELDVFEGVFSGLIIAEVEFPDIEKAKSFIAPGFLSCDVTNDTNYYNSTLSSMNSIDISKLTLS